MPLIRTHVVSLINFRFDQEGNERLKQAILPAKVHQYAYIISNRCLSKAKQSKLADTILKDPIVFSPTWLSCSWVRPPVIMAVAPTK